MEEIDNFYEVDYKWEMKVTYNIITSLFLGILNITVIKLKEISSLIVYMLKLTQWILIFTW